MARKRVTEGGSVLLVRLLNMCEDKQNLSRTLYCVADNAIYDFNHCLYCPHYMGQEACSCGKLYYRRLK